MTATAKRPGLGEPIEWFHAASLNGPADYSIDIAGGRPVLMLFFGSAAHPVAAEALAKVRARRPLFDDVRASFYGVTVDPGDAAEQRIALELPGIRYFLDYDRAVSRRFFAAGDQGQYMPFWLLLDRTLRVVAEFPIREGDAALAALEALATAPAMPDWAPVLMVPNVLEPEFCRTLIDLYDADGGHESGVMREVEGRTKLVLDAAFKVRRDFLVPDGPLAQQLLARLVRRLTPMVKRSFQYEATNVERLLVGCYDEADGGHFRAHRDDTTRGTAHRKFAVTLNLNAEEYEGGDLVFPEFGPRRYRAPTGTAIVFSCSLLHQVTPVTRGRRFALLPFLYDDASAKLRADNMHLIDTDPMRVGAGSAPKTASG